VSHPLKRGLVRYVDAWRLLGGGGDSRGYSAAAFTKMHFTHSLSPRVKYSAVHFIRIKVARVGRSRIIN
jgi:hypothetical protein